MQYWQHKQFFFQREQKIKNYPSNFQNKDSIPGRYRQQNTHNHCQYRVNW